MALNAGSLAADLANRRELAPFWLVTGSEDLLMLESADLLRRRARELGYTDRQVLELSASADWSQLPDAAASVCSTTKSSSKFGCRQVVPASKAIKRSPNL